MEQQKFCGNCGSKMDDNAVFCAACGTKLSSDLQMNAGYPGGTQSFEPLEASKPEEQSPIQSDPQSDLQSDTQNSSQNGQQPVQSGKQPEQQAGQQPVQQAGQQYQQPQKFQQSQQPGQVQQPGQIQLPRAPQPPHQQNQQRKEQWPGQQPGGQAVKQPGQKAGQQYQQPYQQVQQPQQAQKNQQSQQPEQQWPGQQPGSKAVQQPHQQYSQYNNQQYSPLPNQQYGNQYGADQQGNQYGAPNSGQHGQYGQSGQYGQPQPQYPQSSYMQGKKPYPGVKKRGGGKFIAILIVIVLLGVGCWWLYNNVITSVFNTSNAKGLSPEKVSGEYTGFTENTSIKGANAEVYKTTLNNKSDFSMTLSVDNNGSGTAVFASGGAGEQITVVYKRGAIKMLYDQNGIKIDYKGTVSSNTDGFLNIKGTYKAIFSDGTQIDGKWEAAGSTQLAAEDIQNTQNTGSGLTDPAGGNQGGGVQGGGSSDGAGNNYPADVKGLIGYWEGTLTFTKFNGLDESTEISEEEKQWAATAFNNPARFVMKIADENDQIMASLSAAEPGSDSDTTDDVGIFDIDYSNGRFNLKQEQDGAVMEFTGIVNNQTINGTFIVLPPPDDTSGIKSMEGTWMLKFISTEAP